MSERSFGLAIFFPNKIYCNKWFTISNDSFSTFASTWQFIPIVTIFKFKSTGVKHPAHTFILLVGVKNIEEPLSLLQVCVYCMSNIVLIYQKSGNVFCKGPGSKCVWLCRPYSLSHHYSVEMKHKGSHRQYVNEWACCAAVKLDSQKEAARLQAIVCWHSIHLKVYRNVALVSRFPTFELFGKTASSVLKDLSFLKWKFHF